MKSVNSYDTTNEIPQPISDAFLREKYCLTEEYAKGYPEDFAKVLSLVRGTEENLQIMDRLEQAQKEVSSGMVGLQEDSKELKARLDNIIESSEKNTQALRKLADSSSELREMTSSIANFAKRFFKPVQSGWNYFCFLTGYKTPVAALPRENPLSIEDTPENTISNIDPVNQPSVNEKKLRKLTQTLYGCGRILCFVFEVTKNLLVLICRLPLKLMSKIHLWFRQK